MVEEVGHGGIISHTIRLMIVWDIWRGKLRNFFVVFLSERARSKKLLAGQTIDGLYFGSEGDDPLGAGD